MIAHVKYRDKLQLYQVQVGKGIHVGIYAKGYNVRVNDTAKDMSISYVQSIPSTLAKLLPGSLLLAPTHGGIARDDTFVLHKSQKNTQLLNTERTSTHLCTRVIRSVHGRRLRPFGFLIQICLHVQR